MLMQRALLTLCLCVFFYSQSLLTLSRHFYACIRVCCSNQLAPWRKPPGWEAYTRDDVSSWGQEPPLVVHRSFILPVTATDISVTRTRYGITTPHLLLTTSQDGLLSLDRRILDPRRPTNETSKHEQAEGLIQYSPVLPLRHSWLLTGGRPVQGAHLTHSAPSAFESTTLIALLGEDEAAEE